MVFLDEEFKKKFQKLLKDGGEIKKKISCDVDKKFDTLKMEVNTLKIENTKFNH